MKLREVTLLAAITQLLGAFLSIIQWVKFAIGPGRWDIERTFDVTVWGVNDLASVALVAFLFTLVSRQKTV